jgi:hypothetical protein
VSKTLEKRAVAAETIANAKLDAEVTAIFEKYGYDNHRLAAEASKAEFELVIRWGTPHLKEIYYDFMNVFFPSLIKNIFEERIYPLILHADKSKEDTNLVSCIDSVYDDLVNGHLMDEFKKELRKAPEPTVNPDGFEKWLTSNFYGSKLQERLKKSRENLEQAKDRIRTRVSTKPAV